MKNLKTTLKTFIIVTSLFLGACHNSGSEKENGEGVKSETNQETKILVFEQHFGSNENQKADYKLTFQGDSVEISYQYSNNAPIIEKAELKDGKVLTEGCSDCYVISQGNLCVPNPETGESDCYAFNKSKSTHSIEETIYQSKNNLNGNEVSENSQGQDNKKTDIKTLNEIKLALLDAGKKKCDLLLGSPDRDDILYMGNESKLVRVYLNKVIDTDGKTKHLVLFLRDNHKQQIFVEDVKAISDGEKAYDGIHYVEVNNGVVTSNSNHFGLGK